MLWSSSRSKKMHWSVQNAAILVKHCCWIDSMMPLNPLYARILILIQIWSVLFTNHIRRFACNKITQSDQHCRYKIFSFFASKKERFQSLGCLFLPVSLIDQLFPPLYNNNNMSNLLEISSDEQFGDLLSKKDTVYVLNFWASWAEPCQQMNEVFAELAGKFPALQFLKVS